MVTAKKFQAPLSTTEVLVNSVIAVALVAVAQTSLPAESIQRLRSLSTVSVVFSSLENAINVPYAWVVLNHPVKVKPAGAVSWV